MLKNYLLVAVRNLLRNPAISLIHITGFGLGIAAFLFAIQTVIFEFSFDDFHPDREKIFHISTSFRWQEFDFTSSAPPALYHQIKAQMPEVQFATRYIPQAKTEPYCVLSYTPADGTEKSYNELHARYVDEDFLKVFDFALLKGNRETALDGKSSIVMSESVAKKYFGSDDPIGKVIKVRTGGVETRQTEFTYQVTGVLEDVPANSSLQFDILLPFRSFEENYLQDLKTIWYWPGYYTFIKMTEIEDRASLTSKINSLIPVDERKRLMSANESLRFNAQTFEDFHFNENRASNKNTADDDARIIITKSKTYTKMIGLIGLAILIVAAVNYINLTTAKSLKRGKEVGIRKVIGARESQLIHQFLLDAFLFNILGFSLAVTLLQIGRPLIEIWSGHSYTVFSWNPGQIPLYFVILFGSTLLSGIIPATFLTRLEPARALKNVSLHPSGGAFLRKGMVVFQFVVSVGLIVFTFAIFLQVHHMQSKDKGFEADRRIIIKSIGTEDFDFSKFRVFKERVQQNPTIFAFTGAYSLPGLNTTGASDYSTQDKPTEQVVLFHNAVDYDFVKTLGLALVAGRDFTEDRMTDERVVIINESSVKALGYGAHEEAIGQIITFHWPHAGGPRKLKIIGVVRDFNSASPAKPVRSEIFMFANTGWPYAQYNYFIAHMAPGQSQESIAYLEKEWKKIFPGAPFEYTFQDAAFQKVFERDVKIQHIAGLSTVLAIIIACMGLGGLVAYSVGQRKKEIGIRKTLGASVGRILTILLQDFLGLIFISVVLAIPIGWVMVSKFLENYEYRINLSVLMFLIPCLAMVLIAIATMSYQTIKAAKGKPVEALKYE